MVVMGKGMIEIVKRSSDDVSPLMALSCMCCSNVKVVIVLRELLKQLFNLILNRYLIAAYCINLKVVRT